MNDSQHIINTLHGISLWMIVNAVATFCISISLLLLISKNKNMATTLQDLFAQVQQEDSVIKSLVTLTNGLGQQLQTALANQDLATIQKIADVLTSDTNLVVQTVTANTPPAPAPAPVDGGQPTAPTT